MARYTGPKHKLSRREGVDLFGTGGVSLQRRLAVPPGGRRRARKPTEFALQLREKQKVKRMYGVLERQFRRYYEAARSSGGATGVNLLVNLERRLDNVVYRLGWARTRVMARQLVTHGHITVNGKRVNIPSYSVRPGEVVGLTERAQQIVGIQDLLENPEGVVPEWLERTDGSGRMVRMPTREEIGADINEELIVEYYSR